MLKEIAIISLAVAFMGLLISNTMITGVGLVIGIGCLFFDLLKEKKSKPEDESKE